jgi:hypothetical protein
MTRHKHYGWERIRGGKLQTKNGWTHPEESGEAMMKANLCSRRKIVLFAALAAAILQMLIHPPFVELGLMSRAQGGSGEGKPKQKRILPGRKKPSAPPPRSTTAVSNANTSNSAVRNPTAGGNNNTRPRETDPVANANNRAGTPSTPMAKPDTDLLPQTSYAYGLLGSIPESAFREISDKRKVFVNVTGEVGDQLTARLRECGGLEIVKTAKEAEFALTFDSWSGYFSKAPSLSLSDIANQQNPDPVFAVPKKTPTPFSPDNLESRTGGTLIATIRDPTKNVPRIVWSGQDTDGLFSRAADKLTERFITAWKELDILLPNDFLQAESKRRNWEGVKQPRYLIEQNVLQAEAAPTPNIWQPSPPWLVQPTPTPFPTIDPEKFRKVFGREPPRALATPVPIVPPKDQIPVYFPPPTSTPLPPQIILSPAPAARTEDSLAEMLTPRRENSYRPLNTIGQFSEMLGKTKVFMNATGPSRERIMARLREYGRPEIVFTAQEAEFALNYFNWIDGSKGGTLIVTIRDPNERLPRIVWREGDLKSSEAFDKLVKRFINELKRLRREK